MTNRTQTNNVRSFFFNEKPYHALLYVYKKEKTYASEVSNEIDTTYSHAVKKLNRMKELGLVTKESKGRKELYRVTDTGRKLASLFEQVESDVHDRPVPLRQRT
ncbi:winged helix-turn-helix domain-containing protein [Halobium palmae]|uniref:Winged helix-turn-helix domain-containing protein n=1 Tax=Halobium palmae TaxID=1776492 RepID=A0ABD5RWY5_9EURY